MFRSISGCSLRHSTHAHRAASTTAATSSPITFGEDQPHSGASLTATSSATSQADSRTAASQAILPGVRIGDSGMTKCVATAASATAMPGIQNSQW